MPIASTVAAMWRKKKRRREKRKFDNFYREPRKCFIYRRFRGFSLLCGKILVINGVISSVKGQVFLQLRFALTGTGGRKC